MAPGGGPAMYNYAATSRQLGSRDVGTAPVFCHIPSLSASCVFIVGSAWKYGLRGCSAPSSATAERWVGRRTFHGRLIEVSELASDEKRIAKLAATRRTRAEPCGPPTSPGVRVWCEKCGAQFHAPCKPVLRRVVWMNSWPRCMLLCAIIHPLRFSRRLWLYYN